MNRRTFKPDQIPADFAALVSGFRESALRRLFAFIWEGYRNLLKEQPVDIRWDNEPSINSHLYRRIVMRIWPKGHAFEFACEHGIEENRLTKKGLPPKPDFSIHPRDNRLNLSLSIEAKLIRYSKDTAPYVIEIKDNFCTGRYSPRSSLGAMIAYTSGSFPSLIEEVGRATSALIQKHPDFQEDEHYFSDHPRNEDKFVKINSASIRIHHLLMAVPRIA